MTSPKKRDRRWNAASAVLAADVTFFFAPEEEIAKATAELSTVLPNTPAGVLTSLPGVGIVTANLRSRDR